MTEGKVTLLGLSVTGNRYGLDVADVVAVLPVAALHPLDGVPPFVTGVFRYHGRLVPVVDLCRLHGHAAARPAFGTRLVLVRYPGESETHVLGLVAEGVTDIVDVDRAALQETGVATDEVPWIGPMGPDGEGALVQVIRVPDLLTDTARRALFPGDPPPRPVSPGPNADHAGQ